MYRLLVACYILEAIIAAPQNAASDKHATILSSTNNINPDGSYEYSFKTSNGITREETGYVQYEDKNKYLAVQGSYSYTGADNLQRTVYYVADTKGFRILPPPRTTSAPSYAYAFTEVPSKGIAPDVVESLIGGK